jgi:superfamily I DNA/RNA helicase/RecB family exonuclease
MSVAQGSFDGMTDIRFQFSAGAEFANPHALSASQVAVANLSEASVSLVYGAPGSGKTEAVKALFLKLAQRFEPGEILVLAANRESANSLRDQLALAFQGATPGPLARTLTSFAFGVLRLKALKDGIKLPELISGSEQDRLLAEVISDFISNGLPEVSENWPAQFNRQVIELSGFRAELRDFITACLEHGINVSELAALGRQHQKPEWSASSIFFEKYLAMVSTPEYAGRYDASSLLRIAGQWLTTNQDWPTEIAAIRTVIVDDAQELTPAAMRLLRVLAGNNRGLVLVGDPDSSTLGFRAADPRAMANLADDVAGARNATPETLFLTPNFAPRPAELSAVLSKVSRQIDTARAGRQRKSLIVDDSAATEVVQGEPTSTEESVSDLAASAAVDVRVFNAGELAWLARKLREMHLFEGYRWEEMAVVARSRSTLETLAAALANESVPVQILGSHSPLRDEFASRNLLTLADLALNPRPIQPTFAVELLTSVFGGLDALGIRRLRRALRREELLADGLRNSDELLVALFDAPEALVTIRGSEARKAERFLKLFAEAAVIAADETKSIEDLLWHLWSGSGLDKTWQILSSGVGEVALQANRDLDAIVALFAAANRYAERNPNGDPRVFVAQQLALGLPEDTLALNDSLAQRVTLATPSGLIGRRFKVVALPQLIEGVWPNLRPRSSLLGAALLDGLITGRIQEVAATTKSELPDELRMLYKAIGAASEKLLVSATDSEDDQISQFIGLVNGHIPERESFNGTQLTLRGMAGSLRRTLARSASGAEVDSAALGLARLAAAGVAGAHPDSWYGMLALSTNEPLVDFEDPEAQVWLRPSQLENFAKCPLHWFLNAHGGGDNTFSANLGSLVHKALELGVDINEDSLWGLVESKWHTLSFESAWLEEAGERKAKRMISNMVQYLRKFDAEGGRVLGREVNFEFETGRARIRGQVDRLELYPDGRVMIVDLKTGSKTFSAEEARTHAQLGLYQLAFENGAFADLPGVEGGLAGAKLLLVGAGDKPVERNQPSLAESPETKQGFDRLIQAATSGMAMTERVFIAQVDSHCTNSNEFGSCQIHLTKAVSYGG